MFDHLSTVPHATRLRDIKNRLQFLGPHEGFSAPLNDADTKLVIELIDKALDPAAADEPAEKKPEFGPDTYVSGCRTVVSDTSGRLWVVDPNHGTCTPVNVITYGAKEPQEATDGQAQA